MPFGVVRRAKPANHERLRVVVVMRLGLFSPANFARLAHQLAVAYRIADRDMCGALERVTLDVSARRSPNCDLSAMRSLVCVARGNTMRKHCALLVVCLVIAFVRRVVFPSQALSAFLAFTGAAIAIAWLCVKIG